jgi:serpin B
MANRRVFLSSAAALSSLALGGCSHLFKRGTAIPLEGLLRIASKSAELAYKALAQLVSDQPNQGGVLISPVSLTAALALLSLGAPRKQELDDVFGYEQPLKAIGALQLELEASADIEFQAGQSAWFAKIVRATSQFQSQSRRDLRAQTANIDFGTSEGIAQLNDWVKLATKGKIDQILDEPDASLGFLLISAAYFKGNWQEPFDPSSTSSGKFTLRNGTEIRVPMMSDNRSVAAYFADGVESIALPFKGNQFEMILTKGQTDSHTLAILRGANFAALREKYRTETLDLFIPKMRLSYSGDLKSVYSDLGFEPILGPTANLSEMSRPQVNVGMLLHKAAMEVDEAGAVAAAATVVGGYRSLAPAKPFLLDRPFLISLTHRQTGAVIMSSFVSDPGVR